MFGGGGGLVVPHAPSVPTVLFIQIVCADSCVGSIDKTYLIQFQNSLSATEGIFKRKIGLYYKVSPLGDMADVHKVFSLKHSLF